MPTYTIHALGESQMTLSGGAQLSGFTQGDGSHLVGVDITLNSNAWEAIDVFDTESNYQDSDNSQTLDGAQTFDGTSFADGRRVEAEYQLTVQDPDGNTWTLIGFNINEPGVTSYATVEGLAFIGGPGGFPPQGVPLTVISASEGGSRPYDDLATPICFRAGSRIATVEGPRAVEDLVPGDEVRLKNGGTGRVERVLIQRFPASVVARDDRFWPVRIAPGALGPDLPRRAVWLSRQHRVMLNDWRAQVYFGEEAILVPVHKLVDGDAIRSVAPEGGITYVHVALAAHEVLICEGLGCESFHGAGEEGLEACFGDVPILYLPARKPVYADRRVACLR